MTVEQPRGYGPALEARDVSLAFGSDNAVEHVTLSMLAGDSLAISGPSGSGKTTLLHLLAGVLVPDHGEVRLDGRRFDNLSDRERSEHRLRNFGFVPQFGDLVPELTLLENVALPLRLLGTRRRIAEQRAAEILKVLRVGDAASRRAGAASGGQVQRAAVARALVHEPKVVFADEPTGALDSASGEIVLEALLTGASSRGSTLVLITHDPAVAAFADRQVTLRDGQLEAPAASTSR